MIPNRDSKDYMAGHRGLAGAAVFRTVGVVLFRRDAIVNAELVLTHWRRLGIDPPAR